MDLVAGARKVVAILQHVDKKGGSKVMRKCSLPLTGKGVVDVIITEKAVFHVTSQGLVLKEKVAELSVEEIKAMTEAEFTVASDLCDYRI